MRGRRCCRTWYRVKTASSGCRFVSSFFMPTDHKALFLWAAKENRAGFGDFVVREGGCGEGTIVIGKGRSITGHVVDEAGVPVNGAKISAQPQGIAPLSAEACTDAEGAFRLESLAETTYIVQAVVNLPGDGDVTVTGVETVSLLGGHDRDGLELRLALGTTRVAGRVTDLSGNPIAEASVVLDYWEDKPIRGELARQTDAAGSFAWPQVPLGEYRLTVSCEGYMLHRSELSATRPVPNLGVVLTPCANHRGHRTGRLLGTSHRRGRDHSKPRRWLGQRSLLGGPQ